MRNRKKFSNSEKNATRLLLQMLTGDPVESMEAAKTTIGGRIEIDPHPSRNRFKSGIPKVVADRSRLFARFFDLQIGK